MPNSFVNNVFTDFNAAKSAYVCNDKPAFGSCLPDAVETVVIGAGLLGLSTALELAQEGKCVAVLEARGLCDSPSSRSGGQLWPGYHGAFSVMREEFGEHAAKRAWDLNQEALAVVLQRAAIRADRCDFRPGVLLTSKTSSQAKWIDEEFRIQQASDICFSSYVSGEEIRKSYVNTDLYLNGILFQGDVVGRQYGHLDPLKYALTVAKLAQDKGATILEHCPVTGVQVQHNAGYLVATPRGNVRTRNIVLATGVDFIRPKGICYELIPRSFIPVQTVILATQHFSERLAHEIVPGDACFCDAADSAMNYGRIIPDPSRSGYYRLTFGGADALAQAQVAFEIPKIESEMHAMFPQLRLEGISVETVWAGNCDLSQSGRPFIANPREGIFYASGFSGQGMVNTALYATAIAERIVESGSDKYALLEQINSSTYSEFIVLAWLQAFVELIPTVYSTFREERAERPLRAARAAARGAN